LPLVAAELARINGESSAPSSAVSVAQFVENTYLPFVKDNRAPATYDDYTHRYKLHWKDAIGGVPLLSVQTAQVTAVLTALARKGAASRTLSHTKWFLSGVYEHAMACGAAKANPVPPAQWLAQVARAKPQREYSLAEVQKMLAILEPRDLRAAVAVALAYFAALRPAEIRGLQWADFAGEELHIQRAVWKNHVGQTKTEGSAASVPVIEPLRSLLEKLRALTGGEGWILPNGNGRPLSVDALSKRVIRPALEKAGIEWRGYYPGRRGISSLVTDVSRNALNSTGLLRHSSPVTALRHYTRAQKDSIRTALEQVEQMAGKGEAL
jgi:integrase